MKKNYFKSNFIILFIFIIMFSISATAVSPVVTLITPINESELSIFPMTFTYFVNNSLDMNCSLLINDSVNQVDYSIINGTNTFSVASLSDNTDYTWYVRCVDTAWNVGNSSILYFDVAYRVPTAILTGDELEGLPSLGTDMGDFMGNIVPGLGKFILIIGVFSGIVGLLVVIIGFIKRKLNIK